MKVIEVLANWPPEVFIRRHIEAMDAVNDDLQVEYYSFTTVNETQGLATIAIDVESRADVHTIPRFSSKNVWGKLALLLQYGRFSTFLNLRGDYHKEILLNYFKQLDFDLMHFHTSVLAANLSWICEALNKPYTLSLRGADIQVRPLRSQEAFLSIHEVIEKAVGVHTVCDALGYRYAPEKHTTIYTPIPLPNSGERSLKKKLDREKITFMTIGRLHWRKGYLDLLEAIKRLKETGMNVALIIVGVGPDEDRIRQRIEEYDLSENIDLIGRADFSEITELLQKCDGYIQSSIAEGLSNALLEAMSYQCPVFATDVDGTREVVIEGETGFLLPHLRPDLWPAQLSKVRDKALMEAVSVKASEKVKANFSVVGHGENFIDFYRKIITQEKLDVPQSVRDLQKNKKKIWLTDKNLFMVGQAELVEHQIVVFGHWSWDQSLDRLLRVLFRDLDPQRYKLTLYGYGDLEEEIKYSLDLMNWGHCEIFVMSQDEFEDTKYRAMLIRNAEIFIEIQQEKQQFVIWKNGLAYQTIEKHDLDQIIERF